MNQAIKDYIASLEWQDIESAPRDGTLFLAKVDKQYSQEQLDREQEGWLILPRRPFVCCVDPEHPEYYCHADMHDSHVDDDVHPTHWMPLPDNRAAKVIEMLWECVETIIDTTENSGWEPDCHFISKGTLAAIEKLLSKRGG